MPGAYNLPTTYIDYVTALKNNPKDRDRLISNALDLFSQHYQHSLGYIASSDDLAYQKIYNAPFKQEIEGNNCLKAHGFMARAADNAGIKAITGIFGAARQDYKETNHAALVYKSGENEYTANDWSNSIKIKAPDIITAYRKTAAEHPYLTDAGISSILTKDDKHIAYSEVTIGNKLANNPDPNSVKELNEKFDIAQNKDDKLSFNLNGTYGTDDLNQKYKSTGASLNFSKNVPLPIGEYQLDGDGSMAQLNVKNRPNANVSKNIDYSVLEGEFTQTLKTNPLETGNVTTQGFLSSSISGTRIAREGKNTLTMPNETGILEDKDKLDRVYSENILGSNAKITTENSTTDLTVFSGIRTNKNYNYISGNRTFPNEILNGAEIKTAATVPIGDNDLNIKGKGSAVRVDAKHYSKNIINAEGEASIGEENKVSAYGGLSQENLDFRMTNDKTEKTKKYIGAKFEKEFEHFQLGIDGQTTGKDFKVNTNIDF